MPKKLQIFTIVWFLVTGIILSVSGFYFISLNRLDAALACTFILLLNTIFYHFIKYYIKFVTYFPGLFLCTNRKGTVLFITEKMKISSFFKTIGIKNIQDIARLTPDGMKHFLTSLAPLKSKEEARLVELSHKNESRYFTVTKRTLFPYITFWHFEEYNAPSVSNELKKAFSGYRFPLCMTSGEGKILYVNPEFTEWLGHSVQSLYGSDILNLFKEPPESWKELHTHAFELIDVKGNDAPTLISHIASLPSLDVVCIFMAPCDVTSALVSMNDPFFLDLLPIPAAFLDERGGIKFFNPLLRNKLKSSQGAYMALTQWIAERDKNTFIKILKKIRKTHDAMDPITLRFKYQENQRVLAFLKYFPAYDEGSPGQFLVLFDELMEERLLHAKEGDPKRLQLLGQFAGGIVHDFNNLLTGIMGFCDLLLQKHSDGDGSFTDIMQIKQSAMRAARLIHQLLSFSRASPPSCQPIEVKKCIQDLSPLIRKMIGPKILFTVSEKNPRCFTYGDHGQLEQVLLNLAINARDAMQMGGSLTFCVRSVHLRSEIRWAKGNLSPNRYTLIDVIDTGEGIAEECVKRIFDPFFSTKDPGHGTGLGLANVVQIMESFEGGITVKSKLQKGTIFTLYFPEYTGEKSSIDTVAANSLSVVKQDVISKILLVEDEDPVRLFASRALKAKGHEVIEARDGYQALKLLQEHANISIVITDVMMPGIDGPQLAKKVSEMNKNIKILFVSGYPEDEVRSQLSSVSSEVFFLPKPFALTELVNEIQKLSVHKTKKVIG